MDDCVGTSRISGGNLARAGVDALVFKAASAEHRGAVTLASPGKQQRGGVETDRGVAVHQGTDGKAGPADRINF